MRALLMKTILVCHVESWCKWRRCVHNIDTMYILVCTKIPVFIGTLNRELWYLMLLICKLARLHKSLDSIFV